MGQPAPHGSVPPVETLERQTFAAFPDMDASPTKAWLIHHGTEPPWVPLFDRAFGKKPAVELYDLRNDPHQQKNLADDDAFAGPKAELLSKLTAILTASGDPRVTADGRTYDRPPFAGTPPTEP